MTKNADAAARPFAVRPRIKLVLTGEYDFYGPGPHALLTLIGECSSLAPACAKMGLSYSKGWKMIERIEEQLGCKVVLRSRGGAEKGGMALTEAGEALMQNYSRYQKECEKSANELFKKHFADINAIQPQPN